MIKYFSSKRNHIFGSPEIHNILQFRLHYFHISSMEQKNLLTVKTHYHETCNEKELFIVLEFTTNEEEVSKKKEIKDLKNKIAKINQSIVNTDIQHLKKIEEYTKKLEEKDQENLNYQIGIGIIAGTIYLSFILRTGGSRF